ncbi:Cytosolic iron-sulfur protein assembly protein [Thecaphora frezii]
MAQAQKTIPALQLISELEGHSDRAWHLAWNPRMPLLASCSTDKDVRLHAYKFVPAAVSISTDGPQKSSKVPHFNLREVIPTGHKRTVRQVAWSPSGRTLATASFDSTVGIWERIEDIEGANAEADGERPAASEDMGPIKLSNGGATLDDPEWDCIGTLEGHESECKSVAFSHTGGVLASCSRDKSVWIWEVQPDAEFECLSVLMEHSQDVKVVTWHPKDEILASASYDDAIKLYIDDPSDDWFCFTSLMGHESTVWSLAFSPCGRFLASASDDKTVRIWKRLSAEECEAQGLAPEGKMPGRKGERWVCAEVLRGFHVRTVYSVSWGVNKASTDPNSLGRIATGGGDGRVCVFEVSEGAGSGRNSVETKLVAKIEHAHGVSDVNSVAWAPASLDRETSIEEVGEDGRPLSEHEGITHEHMSDLLATAGDDGTVRIWTVPGSALAMPA